MDASSSAVSFDTLDFYLDLVQAGLTQNQAETITESTVKAFNQMISNKSLATKHDVEQMKNDLQSFIIKTITTTICILGGLQTCLHYLGS